MEMPAGITVMLDRVAAVVGSRAAAARGRIFHSSSDLRA
jgi:hypothetical protein